MDKERFSLLLLEPGEIYFEDFSCTIIINNELSPHSGRLKICSKSIVYDPRDLTSPIIKIPLKDCLKIGLWGDEMQRVVYNDNNILCIECSNHVEMLSGNELKPYKFKPEKEFLFLLKYARVSNILPQICQLQRASTLPTAEQNAMIATIVHSRHARFKFDPLWLSDLTEKILIDMPIDKISPLVVNPGRVVLSAERFYFQPYNNVEPYPVLKVDLKLIKKIIPRRFLLRHVGLEIYWNQSETLSHIYISFSNTSDREQFHKCILEQPNLSLEKQDQDVMTLQWQNGVISNYDYLLYINSLGDRTFNDLTQYPVFPWIVTDYTSERIDLSDKKCYRDLSKPVGALNEERFLKLKERYNEMGSPRFLYGSHYSAPGLVLFYLVRKYPHFMLCLQNGRFDHPDRMFNSMADVFRNCMNNMSDFKELIPEFYDVEQKGSFLVNNQRINFGFRSDGNKVNDVRIPLWAKNPEHFVIKLREALESDFVSDKLNDWIDLIFGYKQRGIEAERANNLYYYLCYEGGIDLDRIKDINERHALEVQIMEFGQIPKQVFTVPHPQRRTSIPVSISLLKISFETSFNKLILHKSFVGHKGTVGSIMISDDKDTVISVGKDSVLKMLSISKCRQLRSISICNMALSSCIQLPDKTLIIGCWDDNILFYDVEFGKISSTFRAHHDAVSVMVWNPKFKHLASGSWDCTVNIWKDLDDVSNRPPRLMQCLVANIDLDAQISCLAYSPDSTLLAIGTKEGELSLWETENYALSRKLENHRAAVMSICFSLDSCKFVSCGDDGIFKVIDVKTGTILFQKQLEEKLCSLSWCNDVLLIGTDQGFIYLWNMIQATMITKILLHDGPINSIASLIDCDYIVTGGHDHKINVWKTSS